MSLREFWRNYNICDAIQNTADSWDEMKQSNMEGVWNKLCPQFVHASREFTAHYTAKARQAVVDIGNQLQLDISAKDVIQLLDSPAEELTNEDLMDLKQQLIAFEEEDWGIQIQNWKKVLTKGIAEDFCLIEAGMANLKEQDPNIERFTKFNKQLQRA